MHDDVLMQGSWLMAAEFNYYEHTHRSYTSSCQGKATTNIRISKRFGYQFCELL